MSLFEGRWRLGRWLTDTAYRAFDGAHDAVLWSWEGREPNAEMIDAWRSAPPPFLRLKEHHHAAGSPYSVFDYAGGVNIWSLRQSTACPTGRLPARVAAEVGVQFLRGCVAAADPTRIEWLATRTAAQSATLTWNGEWRYSFAPRFAGIALGDPKFDRAFAPVAAMLVLSGLVDHPNLWFFAARSERPPPQSPPDDAVALEPWLASCLDRTRRESLANTLQWLEALVLPGPDPAQWCREAVSVHCARERRTEVAEGRALRREPILPAELDERLMIDASDPAYLVAADWLMLHQPERAALCVAHRASNFARAAEVLQLHPELEPAARFARASEYHEGWIRRIIFTGHPGSTIEIERLLVHPSARYLRSIEVAGGIGGNAMLVEVLESLKPRALREVTLSGGGASLPRLLRDAMPWLTTVTGADSDDAGGEQDLDLLLPFELLQ